jgi:hypothetical protein
VSAKLTPEIYINNASSYSRLTAAGRQATVADSHSQNCLQTLFFFFFSLSLPLLRQQPNYTGMLKNLLKLYCIWTWDTLWGFFFVLCGFILFFPFDKITTELLLRHHLQDWRLREEHQNYKDWNFIAFELGRFFCIYIFFSFTYFLFLFFIFKPLSV